MPDPCEQTDNTVQRRITIVQTALVVAATLTTAGALQAVLDSPLAGALLAVGASVLAAEKVGARRFVYGRKVVECAECGEQWPIARTSDIALMEYEQHWYLQHAQTPAARGGPMTSSDGEHWYPALPSPFYVRERGRADW